MIREASLEDAASIAKLLRSLGYFAHFANEHEARSVARVQHHLEEFLIQPNHSVWVAEDDAIVGYIAVQWLPNLALKSSEAYISELFIHEDYRAKGIGSSLLNNAEQVALERGCCRLHLINKRERESYQRRFYEIVGWEERSSMVDFVKGLEL